MCSVTETKMRVDLLDSSRRPWGSICGELSSESESESDYNNPLVRLAVAGHVESLAALVSTLQQACCVDTGASRKTTELHVACNVALQQCSEHGNLASVWFLNHNALATAAGHNGGDGDGGGDPTKVFAAIAAANLMEREIQSAGDGDDGSGSDGSGDEKSARQKVIHVVDDKDGNCDEEEEEESTNDAPPSPVAAPRWTGGSVNPADRCLEVRNVRQCLALAQLLLAFTLASALALALASASALCRSVALVRVLLALISTFIRTHIGIDIDIVRVHVCTTPYRPISTNIMTEIRHFWPAGCRCLLH